MNKLSATLVILMVICCVQATADQKINLGGRWDGSIVLVAAEQEVDVVVNFDEGVEQPRGELWFPMTSGQVHKVEDLKLKPPHVSFSVRDNDGVVSSFDGDLSADGSTLRGTFKESSRVMSFMLRRGKVAPAGKEAIAPFGASINKLDDSADLIKKFNSEAGKVRVILVLNPISFPSRVAVRIVQRFAMDEISDARVRAYAIWIAPNKPGATRLIQYFAGLAPDPRITHLWSTDSSLGGSFGLMLRMYGLKNVCLVFGPESSWGALPPAPELIFGIWGADDRSQAGAIKRLNGTTLTAGIRRLLSDKKPGNW
jgi:hypothetical protein